MEITPLQGRVDSKLEFLSTCIVYASTTIVQNALPLLIGIVIVSLGLSASNVGLAFTLDGLTMGIVAFALSPFISKLPQRQIIWFAMGLLTLAHISMAFVVDATQVMVLRAISGGAAGLALVGLNNIIATSRDPVRFYSGTTASGIIIGIIFFMILSTTIDLYGIRGGFLPIAAFIILTIPLMLRLPNLGAVEADIQPTKAMDSKVLPILFLVAVLTVQASQVAYYAFVEHRLIGIDIDAITIGNWLSIGYFVAFLIMVLASWMGERFGRVAPMAIGLTGHVVCIYLVFSSTDRDVVMAAAILQSPFYFLSIPYQLGIGAEMDRSGKLANFAIGTFFIGNGFGPMIGGFLIDTYDFSAIALFNAVAVVSGLIIFKFCNRTLA